MFHASGCTTPLVSWDCHTRDQGPRTSIRLMGVLARFPGHPTKTGGPTRLMSGPGPHLQ
jgi:hypothetical protein